MALLTVETAGTYALKQLEALGSESPIPAAASVTVKEIEGGNLNYAFCVQAEGGQSVFVKQAPDFIKVFGPDAKLNRERMCLEAAVYKEMATAIGAEAATRFLPRIYSFDRESMTMIMEFLGSHELLQEALYAGRADASAAAALGDFMGLLHSRTHSSKVPSEVAERLTKEYENAELRAVQLEHVFTKPFRESARAAPLRADEAFMSELESLRAKYRGEAHGDLALLHGDLHPGSVMASGVDVKVIDPEFAIYGPPGLDVGSLLSGYALAYMYQAMAGSADSASALAAAISSVWSAYAAALLSGGISGDLSAAIGEDAACYAACEVARTALGCAGSRGLPLKDEKLLERAEEEALGLARRVILGRKGRGVELLVEELGRFASGMTSSAVP